MHTANTASYLLYRLQVRKNTFFRRLPSIPHKKAGLHPGWTKRSAGLKALQLLLRQNLAAIDFKDVIHSRGIQLEPDLPTRRRQIGNALANSVPVQQTAIGDQPHRQHSDQTECLQNINNSRNRLRKLWSTGWLAIAGKSDIHQVTRSLRHSLEHEIPLMNIVQKTGEFFP